MARPVTTSSRSNPLQRSPTSSGPSARAPATREVRVPVPGPPGPPGTVLGLIAVVAVEPDTPPAGFAHIWFDGTNLKIKDSAGLVRVFVTVAE